MPKKTSLLSLECIFGLLPFLNLLENWMIDDVKKINSSYATFSFDRSLLPFLNLLCYIYLFMNVHWDEVMWELREILDSKNVWKL